MVTTTTATPKGQNVIAIWEDPFHNNIKALITDFNGNVKQISWSAGPDTSAYSYCSVLFKDKIYFIGDVYESDFVRQVSRVDGCALKRIGSLSIDMLRATCATTQRHIVMCFRHPLDNQCFTVIHL